MKTICRALVATALAAILCVSSVIPALAAEDLEPEPDIAETAAVSEDDEDLPVSPGDESEDGGVSPEPSLMPGLEMEEHRVYINGNADKFDPSGKLTRAQAAKILYTLLDFYPEFTGEIDFSDVADTDWFIEHVKALAELEIVGGYADGTFRPQRHITRREFVAMISRFFDDLPEDSPAQFTDVAEDAWGYKEISAAAQLGWIDGYKDGTFRPDSDITRAEAVVIINRVLGRQGDSYLLEAEGNPLVFLDLPSSHWAYVDVMEAALEHEHEDGMEGVWISFTQPRASLSSGYHLVDGELYLVDENGFYVHDRQVGVHEFNSYGRYTTGNAELDRKLTALARAHTSNSASMEANFRSMYRYISNENNFPYRANNYIKDGATGWAEQKALEMLNNRRGNCYNYAALCAMVARKAGYQAEAVSGFVDVRLGYGYVEHGWTEINLDGQILVCDPQQQFRFPNKLLFLRKYSEMPNNYRVLGKVKR